MPPEQLFQIPPESAWAAIGSGLVLLLCWIFRSERRASRHELSASQMLTRKEHDEICDKNQEAIASDLTVIKDMLSAQNQSASEHRSKVEETLGTIKTDVAVLQSRMNESRDVEITRVRTRRSKS